MGFSVEFTFSVNLFWFILSSNAQVSTRVFAGYFITSLISRFSCSSVRLAKSALNLFIINSIFESGIFLKNLMESNSCN